MRGTYTTLVDGSNISIQPGQNINIQTEQNTGGIVNEPIDKTIDTIPDSQLQNFNLTFNILYFNSSVSRYTLFPHKVYLYGNKNNRRNLEENNYNYIINFKNCTTGDYSKEEPSAIGSIRCTFPDYVQAGTYSKLVSDGFDVNPNSKINVVFKEDFNRNPSNETDPINQIIGKNSSSSSSSKTWIIWLIAGLLLLVLIIIVILACVCKSKTGNESVENSKYNDGSNNNMQNSNHSDSG